MSDGQEPEQLTLDDPIAPEALQQLANLHNARLDFCDRNTSLDQEKITILAAIKRLDDQKNKLFEALLVERGLTPGTEVTINGQTGKLQLLRRRSDGQVEVAPPAAGQPEPAAQEQAPEAAHS